MTEQEPLVKFDPTTSGAIIRFDVPLPSFYDGIHIIDLKIPDEDWAEPFKSWVEAREAATAAAMTNPTSSSAPSTTSPGNPTASGFTTRIHNSLKMSDLDRTIARLGPNAEVIIPREYHDLYKDIPETKEGLKIVKPHQLDRIEVPKGKTFRVSKTMTGKYQFLTGSQYVPPLLCLPRMAILERYRLETYIGNYGMGKTISSFYIHPKSRVTLTIKSWKTVQETYENSSSIFDSMTQNASSRFENTFTEEQGNSAENTEYSEEYSEIGLSAGYPGYGSVDAKAGTKGGTTNSRGEFSKNVNNAVTAHANESSSTREMQHHVTATVQKDEGEEETIVREIENLNAGHVLNFIVRELNQEYHSVLVLKDIRLVFVYIAGLSVDRYVEEVPLYKIDEFLKRYIQEGMIKHYRDFILNECSYILDHRGQRKSILEIKKYTDDQPTAANLTDAINNYNPDLHYILISKDKHGIGKNIGGRDTGTEIEVEGIPLDVNTITLKTDGIVCSSLLDPGLALDEYSINMQTETHRCDKVQNDLVEADIAKHTLARQLIETGPDEAVERFVKIYGPLVEPEQEENGGSQ